MSQQNNNAPIGCAVTLSLLVNLILAVNAVVHLKGFWRCTGAFLSFTIGGTFAGIIGMGIGLAIAKSKDESAVGMAVGYAILGALFASVIADLIIGNYLLGIDFMRLTQR